MESLQNLPADLLRYYLAGGFVMHLISACALLSLATIAYKLVVFRRVKININEFIARVRSSLLKGNMKAAIQVCEEQRSPVASVVRTGLLKYGDRAQRDQIEKTMESAAIHEVAYLEKHLPILATITTTAPLLGFVGTVVGMILAFDAIADAGLSNPGLVARGISVALVTTAWGLIVAFFTQPFYNYFLAKVAAYTREIQTAANILFETFDEIDRMSGIRSA